MTYLIYQFEAVSIQDYIFADGKIKTMVGASELLESITNELLDEATKKLELKPITAENIKDQEELKLDCDQVIFPRRAGSVFQMVMQNTNKAEAFAKLWPILVSNFAPGLRFSATLKSGDDFNKVSKAVRDELNIQKNNPQSQLPESTPITLRFQKTGKAQVSAPSKNKEGADWTMPAKINQNFDLLSRKHLYSDPFSKEKNTEYCFPKQFEHSHTETYWKEAFPFKSTDPGNHTIAIIHSDGNGLGGYLHNIFEQLNKLKSAKQICAYQSFSEGLDKATQQAAQQATIWLASEYAKEVDNPYKTKVKAGQIPLPMRPIILGGDDLTCIIRADFAIGFIQEFTAQFERKTKAFIKDLKAEFPTTFESLPDLLSCTSGMLFIRSNQPFSLGYALTEQLCSEAKKAGQNLKHETPPSLISFLRTTNTLFDSFDVQFKQELIASDGTTLSSMPYAFIESEKESTDKQRPTLSQLFELKELFHEDNAKKLTPSALRRYATHLSSNPAYAKTYWGRWEKQCKDSTELRDTWNQFETLLKAFEKQSSACPVADLVSLFTLNIEESE